MFELIDLENASEYESFCASHLQKGHFLQSSKWAPVKSSWKWQAVLVKNSEGEIKGGASVLIRKMPPFGYTMMYCGRGPVCDPHDADTLSQLTKGFEALAKKNRAYSLKMDPDIKSDDETFLNIMDRLGYKRRQAGKNFEGIQPNYVYRLPIGGKTEDELMAAFHQKTRYNIRLSYRKGVEVRRCGKEMLPRFSEIMRETGDRDGFMIRPLSYFEQMLDALGEDARLYMAFLDDKAIAGTIAIKYAGKVWYLYGASSNQYRNAMPNYQLQWEMIRWAVQSGCYLYDFRGVSGDLTPENPLYGLYLFKKGFSGELTEFCGELEYTFLPGAAKLTDSTMSFLRKARSAVMLRGRKKNGEGEQKSGADADAD